MPTKETLTARGFTPDSLRERMANCRKGLAEAKATNGPGLYTYRLLFAGWYVQYRQALAILTA